MNFTESELREAKRQIDSTLHKLRETVKTFEAKENVQRYKAQITLAERRIKAFDSAEYKDGTEQDLVNALRNGNAYIPELSLVAEENGKIIGYIMFTKATVSETEILALAPLAVLPEYQRKGVGTAIIWYAGCKTMLPESVELFITQRNLGSTFPNSTKGVRRWQYFFTVVSHWTDI